MAKEKIIQINFLITYVVRIFMGIIFIYASYDKILNPSAFAKVVYNYQILPDFAVNLVALWLPWLEFLLGLSLITGILLYGATFMSTSLLLVFLGALLFNLSRGLNINCGCFSSQSTDANIDIWTILRDISFIACSLYLTVQILFTSQFSKNTKGQIS